MTAPRTQSGDATGTVSNGVLPLLDEPARLAWRGRSLDIRLYRAYGYVLGILLTGYMFLDRGFAHFHLPKLKVVYVGELTLAFGLIALMVGMSYMWRAIARDALIGSLLAFMGWGAFHAAV